jgi:A/G-specific adenine glycosylase
MPGAQGLRRVAAAQRSVLAWFAESARTFPWRGTRDPYRILVAEVMLQQTQTGRVVPMYESFLRRFPTISDLARAQAGEVIRAWKGLGYNRRAVGLHATAQTVRREHGGVIPRDVNALRSMRGIGPYTAAAVACFAFDQQVAVIDVNVRRVLARAAHGTDADGVTRARIDATASAWLPPGRAYEWNQALMDVGATICRSSAPVCGRCPLRRGCAYLASGMQPSRDPTRTKERFEGSRRQARGAIVERLRGAGKRGITVAELERHVLPGGGAEGAAINGLLAHLEADGLVVLSPGARRGSPRGFVRLP